MMIIWISWMNIDSIVYTRLRSMGEQTNHNNKRELPLLASSLLPFAQAHPHHKGTDLINFQ